MKILFRNSKVEKYLKNPKKIQGDHGKRTAVCFEEEYVAIEASNSLRIYKQFSPSCHELKWDRKFQLGVDLDCDSRGRGGLRLVFEPTPPIPCKQDGSLDWNQVTSITLCGIENYHRG